MEDERQLCLCVRDNIVEAFAANLAELGQTITFEPYNLRPVALKQPRSSTEL